MLVARLNQWLVGHPFGDRSRYTYVDKAVIHLRSGIDLTEFFQGIGFGTDEEEFKESITSLVGSGVQPSTTMLVHYADLRDALPNSKIWVGLRSVPTIGELLAVVASLIGDESCPLLRSGLFNGFCCAELKVHSVWDCREQKWRFGVWRDVDIERFEELGNFWSAGDRVFSCTKI